MNWLLKFVPEDKRNLIVLGQRIIACLDTAEERKAAVDYGIQMLADGRVTVGEWSQFGSKLGILRAPRKNN
tara:strand:- start:122 stop:334 length:213 start_codon:yes stop_codon:yes gene_type:complete